MRRGFTLAEVLITIGIIGVIAAITIPTLLNKSNDRVYEVGYKKAYSTLTNVFESLLNDNGGDIKTLCSENKDRTIEGSKCISDAFKPYLKIAKACESGDNADCTNLYTEAVNLNGDATFRTMMIAGRINTNTTFVLTDGSIVSFDYGGSTANGGNCSAPPTGDPDTEPDSACFMLIIDSNGNRKPNKLGLDINLIPTFPMKILAPTKEYFGDVGGCDPKITDDVLNGASCGSLYINGQKIPNAN